MTDYCSDTATPKLRAMIDRLSDLTPLMQGMGQHMLPSVRRNFNEGGRPEPWAPGKFEVEGFEEQALRSATKSYKGRAQRRQGRTRMGGLLVLTGDLRGSIGYTAERGDLVLWSRPEMNPVKAAVHQFGTNRAGRNHDITIPARPFLVFQQEDLSYFRKSADGWIRVGSRAA